MVTNFEYLERWLSDMKVNNFQVWKIDKQGTVNRNNGYCFASKDGTQNSIENFRLWCENNTGAYLLQQSEGNSNNAEIEFSLPFRQKAEKQAPEPQQQPLIGMTDERFYSKREFDIMIENERLKFKIDRLENELKELKENSSASGEFFKTITPFVGPVLQGFIGRNAAPAATQIAGLDATTAENDSESFDISEEDFKQLTEDLKRWSAKDPEYLTVIHKLSLFVENPMYITAKGMLFNQQ